MNIGELVKEYRKKAKLTQKELAAKSGLAIGTIQQYENGKRIPISKNAKIISDILGIDLDYMMSVIFEQYYKDPDFKLLYGTEATKAFKREMREQNVSSSKNRTHKEKTQVLLDHYNKLNELGKDKAIERVGELTELKKYTDKD